MRYTSAIIAAAGIAASAHADIITFDALGHGEVVADQYADLGLSISVDNFNKDFNALVAFNSNLTGTADPDLEFGNRTSGNLAENSGNVLIIQENDLGLDTGFASDPDDEAGRAAGQIVFSFSTALTSFGFDVLDVDDESVEMSSVEFYSGDTLVQSYDFADFVSPLRADGVAYGDGSANRIAPLGADSDFDRVVFNVGGSMAFDNIDFTVVPAPSALMAFAGLLLIAPKRRR